MDFDIKQLQVFLAVADNLGFSRAAKVLDMAQASVSERIAGLEQVTGARLFDRLGRKISLTPAGERLVGHARELVAARDRTVSDMRAFLDIKGGEVRIGGSTAPGEYRLPAILAELRARFPGIVPRLRIADSDTILDDIADGVLELGVVGKKDNNDHLLFKKLWSDRLVLVASPSRGLAQSRGPVGVDVLLRERWITREDGSATRAEMERVLRKALAGKPSLEVAAQLGSVTAVKEGVKAGLGIALLSEMTVATEIAAGTLVRIEVDGLSVSRSFYLVRDRRRASSPASEEVWRHIAHTA